MPVIRNKPISFYRGTEPICRFSSEDKVYRTFVCNHPKKTDLRRTYECSCTELEWSLCPLNPEKLEKK